MGQTSGRQERSKKPEVAPREVMEAEIEIQNNKEESKEVKAKNQKLTSVFGLADLKNGNKCFAYSSLSYFLFLVPAVPFPVHRLNFLPFLIPSVRNIQMILILPCQVTILSFFKMECMKISKLFPYLSPQIGHCIQKCLAAGSVSLQTQPALLDWLNHGLGTGYSLQTGKAVFAFCCSILCLDVLWEDWKRGTGRNLSIISQVSLDFFLPVAKKTQMLSAWATEE